MHQVAYKDQDKNITVINTLKLIKAEKLICSIQQLINRFVMDLK